MADVDATLTTVGRRSGEPRAVRLYAWPDGDSGRSVLIGSGWAGGDAEPAWVRNLRAEARCTLRLGQGRRGEERTGRAIEIVEATERARLWAVATASFPYYEAYQARTDRPIPVFVFEPEPEPVP